MIIGKKKILEEYENLSEKHKELLKKGNTKIDEEYRKILEEGMNQCREELKKYGWYI